MQPTGKACSRCGAPLLAQQAFCAVCGTAADATKMDTPTHVTPPPPPPYSSEAERTSKQSGQHYPPPPSYAPQAQWQQGPDFAQPMPPDSSRKVMRQFGCGFLLVILVLLLACGGVGYGAYIWLSGLAQETPSQTEGNTSSTTATTSGSTATSVTVPATTSPVNLKVIFATVDLEFTTLQQASSFVDGANSLDGSVIRVNVREANNTAKNVRYYYPDIARLILPDKSSITPTKVKYPSPPANGATQSNWLDFAVPANITTEGLVLRLGNANQAQMDIPLKEKADISQYQPKTATVNKSLEQGTATWTLSQATLSWSGNATQAETGKRYVTLQMEISTTANINYGLGSNMRLQAGESISTAEFDATTIPQSLPAGSTAKGQATFLVPQGVTSFTFTLLATGDIAQTSIDFQI